MQALTLGTIAWAIAGIVLLLFFRPQLAAHDASWWLWVCLVGALLGLVALPYVLRRRAVYQRAAATDRGTHDRHHRFPGGGDGPLGGGPRGG